MPSNQTRGTGAKVRYEADDSNWSASVIDPNCGLLDMRTGLGTGVETDNLHEAATAASELAGMYGVPDSRVAEHSTDKAAVVID